MYVRVHQRPAFHAALGVDVDWYGQEVFRKTSELSKQIFPITLDIDHPRWMANLNRLRAANVTLAEAADQKGFGGLITRTGARLQALLAFVSLYTIPSKSHAVPVSTRLEPAY